MNPSQFRNILMGKALRFILAAIVSATSFLGTSGANASGDGLVFGVVPQQSASRLARDWGPMMKWLGDKIGQQVMFATAKDIPTFEACLARGAYDIAYMNPYHYVIFHKIADYRAIAHQSEKRLKGILVTRTDSPVASLADLAGATVAFPSPAAFGASVLPRAEMAASGIEFKPAYVRSHDSVYRAVADGIYPAGGGVLRTFKTIPDDLKSQLAVFFETEAYTPHAFAVHHRVDDARAKVVTAALKSLADEAPALIQRLGMSGIEPAFNAAWNDVRELGLTRQQTEVVAEAQDQCHSN